MYWVRAVGVRVSVGQMTVTIKIKLSLCVP
jgi:hypothetical protein